ncbi:MAG: hypothetical protein AB8B56_20945 [Crocinitomicaceae bacterium]
MKDTILLFVALLFHLIATGQTPEPHEVRFRLYNESGELLTCDSLHSDTLNLIELSGNFISYEYNSTSHFHIVKTNTFYSHLPLHWARNGKVMDLMFVIHDTTARKIEYCSFDRLQFEEGQFTVRVRTNTSHCETYEASKAKYFENILVHEENGILHYNWDSLTAFKAKTEGLCFRFDLIIEDPFMLRLACH